MKNDKCDGAYCIMTEGEVKKYPIGDDSHMILCVYCWGHENRFREDMSKEYPDEFVKWPQQNWFEFEPYEGLGNTVTKTDIIKQFAKEHGLTVVEAPLGHMDQPGGQPVSYNEMPTLDEIIVDINKVLGTKPKK